MPAPLLHVGATVLCSHAGQATPTAPMPRVLLNGQPAVTISCVYTVAGCSMPTPPTGNGPCVSAQYTNSATRVMAGGQPVLLQTNTATCVPTGTPLMATVVQTRVIGS